jgi:hypothetical protein
MYKFFSYSFTQRGLINLNSHVFCTYRRIATSREVIRNASIGNIVFFHLNPIKIHIKFIGGPSTFYTEQ